MGRSPKKPRTAAWKKPGNSVLEIYGMDNPVVPGKPTSRVPPFVRMIVQPENVVKNTELKNKDLKKTLPKFHTVMYNRCRLIMRGRISWISVPINC
jgi:hypothetical protein